MGSNLNVSRLNGLGMVVVINISASSCLLLLALSSAFYLSIINFPLMDTSTFRQYFSSNFIWDYRIQVVDRTEKTHN